MDKVLAAEKADVIAKIKGAIAHYGLTAADLGIRAAGKGGSKSKGVAKSKAKAAPESRVKYKDEAGNSWSGYGRKPQWFVDALAAGKKPEELLA